MTSHLPWRKCSRPRARSLRIWCGVELGPGDQPLEPPALVEVVRSCAVEARPRDQPRLPVLAHVAAERLRRQVAREHHLLRRRHHHLLHPRAREHPRAGKEERGEKEHLLRTARTRGHPGRAQRREKAKKGESEDARSRRDTQRVGPSLLKGARRPLRRRRKRRRPRGRPRTQGLPGHVRGRRHPRRLKAGALAREHQRPRRPNTRHSLRGGLTRDAGGPTPEGLRAKLPKGRPPQVPQWK